MTIRRRGRPIVTGSDFDQPRTSRIEAETRTMRAASTAGRYSLPKTTRTSHGIVTRKTGKATAATPAAAIE